MMFSYIVLFGLLSCVKICICRSDRILFSDVKAITLHHGQLTAARRVKAVPQLNCASGIDLCNHEPSTVQCINMGTDGIDMQWKCEGKLPNNIKFDKLKVSCEGYEYPDDPYILSGSCGLSYTLKSIKDGHKHKQKKSKTFAKTDPDASSLLMMLGGIALVIFLIYFFCLAGSNPTSSPVYRDSPPPYESASAPPEYGFRSDYTESDTRRRKPEYSSSAPVNDNNSGPGFWTGAAMGGAAGYLFGSSGSRSTQHTGTGYSETVNDYHSSGSGSGSANSSRESLDTGFATTSRR